ncbi:MAG: universal stress protein [Saprospiraceae bacterium]|nr:universal stress protein [Saprospiraceae bacterium]
MQNILVPTDFSPLAKIATDTATKMAMISHGEITFYHSATEIPQDWKNWPLNEKDKFPENQKIMSQLVRKMNSLKKHCKSLGIPCQSIVRTGPFLENLEEVVMQEKIDLIIMGSHGVSGKQEFFIGSNTQKVIRRVHSNLLIVKEPIDEIRFKKILFAASLGISDQEAFADFLSIIKIFKPEEIHLVTIDTPGFFNQPTILVKQRQKDFKKMASNLQLKTHFVRNFTIEAGIRKFSESKGVDLIVISNYERHPIKRIFSGSTVEMLANHSNLPVLSLDKISDF